MASAKPTPLSGVTRVMSVSVPAQPRRYHLGLEHDSHVPNFCWDDKHSRRSWFCQGYLRPSFKEKHWCQYPGRLSQRISGGLFVFPSGAASQARSGVTFKLPQPPSNSRYGYGISVPPHRLVSQPIIVNRALTKTEISVFQMIIQSSHGVWKRSRANAIMDQPNPNAVTISAPDFSIVWKPAWIHQNDRPQLAPTLLVFPRTFACLGDIAQLSDVPDPGR